MSDQAIQLMQGDCLEIMPLIPAESADMILTDLPYGTTACKWDVVIPFAPLWEAYKRLVKARGAVALFGNEPFTSQLRLSNLEWYKYDWSWTKTKASNHVNAKIRPMNGHENIAVFSGGTIANGSASQMAYYPQGLTRVDRDSYRPSPRFGGVHGQRPSHQTTVHQEYTGYPSTAITFANPNNDSLHPTQKPVALLEYLIRTYTNPGETVLDSCMGSGSTAIACMRTGRRFIGIEKDPIYFEVSCQRVKDEHRQGRLFTL